MLEVQGSLLDRSTIYILERILNDVLRASTQMIMQIMKNSPNHFYAALFSCK